MSNSFYAWYQSLYYWSTSTDTLCITDWSGTQFWIIVESDLENISGTEKLYNKNIKYKLVARNDSNALGMIMALYWDLVNGFGNLRWQMPLPGLLWIHLLLLLCTSRLNGLSDLRRLWSEVKDETAFRYARDEIWTQVILICGPTPNQLGHVGAPFLN